MVRLALLLLVMAASPMSLPQVATGTIQGTVTLLGTSEPLPDVQISIAVGPDRPDRVLNLTAVTDETGHFTIRKVPTTTEDNPETWVWVYAERDGYFGGRAAGYSGRSEKVLVPSVNAAQTTSVTLSLTPGGTISGKVTDAMGRPISNVMVTGLRPMYVRGLVETFGVGSRFTDDRGEYRLFGLPPELLYVQASVGQPSNLGPRPLGNESQIRTFYPSERDLTTALPLRLRSGEEMSGIDICLLTAVPVRVSGRVTSSLPADATLRAARAELSLISRGQYGSPPVRVSAEPDGSFEIPNVFPGSYDVIARMPAAAGWSEREPSNSARNTAWAFGRTSIDVRDDDVKDIIVVVHPGSDLRGTVTLDGKPTAADVRIKLESDIRTGVLSGVMDRIAEFQPTIGSDGSFIIPHLPEGRYRVEVYVARFGQILEETAESPSVRQAGLIPLPEDTYVADIRQPGVSVYDNGLHIDDRVPLPIEVLLKTGSATVDGTVIGIDKKPVTGATVVLAPSIDRRQNPRLYQARTNAGEFRFQRVPPGIYKIFAWKSVEIIGAYENPQFLYQFEQRGVSVSVPTRSTVTVTIPVIP